MPAGVGLIFNFYRIPQSKERDDLMLGVLDDHTRRFTPAEVEALRRHFRMTYEELAELSEVPVASLHNYVAGKCTFERRPLYHRQINTAFRLQFGHMINDLPV